ncbi:MAG: thioester domain-containing protein, partial [Erysipelotrichaceae bacterium]
MKIKLKKLLVTIFTFAILLQPFATVKANGSKDTVLNESGYLPYTYSASGDSHGGDFATRYGQLRKLYMGGQVVFCVEPWNVATAGTVYTNYDFPASVRSRMSYIAYHGYLTHQTDEWYMASQLMIWEELGWTINSTNLPNYQGMKNTI